MNANYRVSIQAIEERLDNAIDIANQMKGTIYLDKEKKGVYPTFINIIKEEVVHNKPLVHFQDDVILADKLEDYIDTIIKDMEKMNMHLISLFVPRRKAFDKSKITLYKYSPKNKYLLLKPFLWCQGIIMSSKLLKLLAMYDKLYVKNNKGQKLHDDVFIDETLKEFNINAYVHIPGLVQHDITIKSSLNHTNSVKRTSELFNKDFIINKK